jgi:hypothetical protein
MRELRCTLGERFGLTTRRDGFLQRTSCCAELARGRVGTASPVGVWVPLVCVGPIWSGKREWRDRRRDLSGQVVDVQRRGRVAVQRHQSSEGYPRRQSLRHDRDCVWPTELRRLPARREVLAVLGVPRDREGLLDREQQFRDRVDGRRVPDQRCCRHREEMLHSRVWRHPSDRGGHGGLGERRNQRAGAPSVSTRGLRRSTEHRQRTRCGAIECTASCRPRIRVGFCVVVDSFHGEASISREQWIRSTTCNLATMSPFRCLQ